MDPYNKKSCHITLFLQFFLLIKTHLLKLKSDIVSRFLNFLFITFLMLFYVSPKSCSYRLTFASLAMLNVLSSTLISWCLKNKCLYGIFTSIVRSLVVVVKWYWFVMHRKTKWMWSDKHSDKIFILLFWKHLFSCFENTSSILSQPEWKRVSWKS